MGVLSPLNMLTAKLLHPAGTSRRRSMKRRSRRSLRRPATAAAIVYSQYRSSSGTTDSSILRRVRALKKLIPQNRESSSSLDKEEVRGGLEGLFCDTANYIMSLQMRVRIMHIMLDQFTTTTDDSSCSPPTE